MNTVDEEQRHIILLMNSTIRVLLKKHTRCLLKKRNKCVFEEAQLSAC